MCNVPSKEMLPAVIEMSSEHLDFSRAKDMADSKAREMLEDPMLLAWYEAKTGAFSPRVE